MLHQAPERQLQGHSGARPWGVPRKIAPEGGARREGTHPLPHTCSAAELRTRGSSAWGFPGGSRDSLPRPGRAPLARGSPIRKRQSSLAQSSRLSVPVFISTFSSNWDRVVYSSHQPLQLQTIPTFLCHLANRQDTKKKKERNETKRKKGATHAAVSPCSLNLQPGAGRKRKRTFSLPIPTP